MLPKFATKGLDLFFPGPSDGRNGDFRKLILDLEFRKKDANLRDLFALEDHSQGESSWSGLGTIAYELVKHFKPQKIVELGSHKGFSTFAMGLALRDLARGGQIYAVDTWKGDLHTGAYAEDVYQRFLADRHTLGLEDIVRPMRMTFAEASTKITPPIDLLHVDGLHTFKAVTSDFYSYRRRLAPGAVVLFHDVFTTFRQMRVFWGLLSWRYPSYRIPYSNGLGVIQV
jgi:predicted O-methyltransferase YrrM